MQTTNDTNLDTKLSAIDKALAAAKARKAAKESASTPDAAAAEPKAKKETHPEFAKVQKTEALKAAREAAKAARDVERQKRRDEKAEASASKKPVHMKKIETAASKLPALQTDAARRVYEDVVTNFSHDQITALALHLQHFTRTKATERALGQRVAAGTQVRIIGGDPRFVGKFGTVDRAQRIRCYVNVPGIKRPVYLFTSDVEVLQIKEPAVSESVPVAAVG